MIGIDYMKQYLGKQEVKDKTELRAFFRAHAIKNDIDIDPSKVAWCAAMVNACERAAGKPGTGKLLAQSFNKYGKEVLCKDARPGDIVVFHFPTDKPGHGHVTYFVAWDDANNKVKCLGGNQRDEVNISVYSHDHIIHIRRCD